MGSRLSTVTIETVKKNLSFSVPRISILSACHYKTIERGFDQI